MSADAKPITLATLLREVLPAASRLGRWDHQLVALASLLGVEGRGMTGAGITFDADRIGAALGIGRSRVYDLVKELRWTPDTPGGVLEQTQHPSRAKKGRPGRRARYRLVRPEWCPESRPPVQARTAGHDSAAESCPPAEREPLDGSTSDGPTYLPPPPLLPHPHDPDLVAEIVRRIRSRTGDDLTPRAATAAAALDAGWRVDEIVNTVTTATLNGARDRVAVLAARIEQLGAPPRRRPRWCTRCREIDRLIEDENGTPSRCPRCHPAAIGTTS